MKIHFGLAYHNEISFWGLSSVASKSHEMKIHVNTA